MQKNILTLLVIILGVVFLIYVLAPLLQLVIYLGIIGAGVWFFCKMVDRI